MNNSDFITIAALKRELDHITLKYGFKPEPEGNPIANDKVWLSQNERLMVITDYIKTRLNELET